MNEAARRQSSVGWVGGDEWDVHKSTISDLYQTQNLPLKDVMKVMEDRHGFRATQRMYKTRIKSWGLDKNFKECEVVELFRLRRERERAGKTLTRYMLRGREVDWDRVQNYVRRKGLNISQLLAANDAAPLARDISCTTPPPCCGRDHGDHNRREPVGGASSPSSSPSLSPQSISSPPYEAGFAVPSASNCTRQQRQQPSPISPATVNSSVLKTTTPMTAHPTPRRPPPPLLPKPSPHRRASYPLPPPRTASPLHHRNQYQHPFLPFQPTASTLADSIVVQNDNDTNQLESFQLFLMRLYRNTMFQDGNKAWGTTEYWLRNTRSLEWFMGIRYKLALHRNQIFSSPAPPSGSRLKKFQMLNRAFAVLEPLSSGVIPSRMWYVMNFIAGFVPSGEGEGNQKRQVGKDQEVFRETIDKMLVEIQKKCGRPPSGMAVSPSATGFKVEEAKQALVCTDDMMMMDIDDDEEYDRNRVYDNDGVRRKGWYFGENAGFHETAMRFLLEILEKMYENLMVSGPGSGSPLAMEAALLLEEGRNGYPVCRGNWRPASYDRAAASRMSISSVSSNWQNSLLSPVSPADGSSTAEMLESAVWLLSREEDAKAEVQLRALIELAEQQGGKSSGLLPSPNRTLGLGGFATEHSSSGGVRLAQAKTFARCAHYHLSRIYRRQGRRAAASEHLRLSVEGSLLFDEFVGWEEVEFLFA